MNNDRSAICCISGGADSVTMAYYVSKVIKPEHQLLLFCNYGQRTYDYEEFCIKQISRRLKAPLKLIDVRWLGKISTSLLTHAEKEIPETRNEDLWDSDKARDRILKWWDPCRNALLLLVGLAHAESFYISTRERFDVYIGIRRETPVAMKDNTVVKLGDELGVPWAYTYSCYAGYGFKTIRGKKYPVHCGRCSNDKRRALAFKMSGVYDGSLYSKPPLEDVEYAEINGIHIQKRTR